jgi:hypothetical protein
MSDMERLYELNRLRADNFDEEISPEQKKYYLELNDFYREHRCATVEEATEMIKGTPYYDGMTRAKILDEINYREKAMRDAGYDDVADIHAKRRERFLEEGLPYAYSQEWIEGYNEAEAAITEYTRRKEVFGSIFSAYFNIVGNPQQQHRTDAVRELCEGLNKLSEMGVTFDELAQNRAYRMLTMTTDAGMQRFVDFVHCLAETGEAPGEEHPEIEEEQKRIGRWAAEHQSELIETGRQEKWHRANCAAVPSDDPCGYDFISLKEVDG